MVIVVDDADRENEGDLVFAAQKSSPALERTAPPRRTTPFFIRAFTLMSAPFHQFVEIITSATATVTPAPARPDS